MKTKLIKICIVSSCGGHLTEVRELKSVYEAEEHFYVLNDNAILPEDMIGKTYFIAHSERDWKFFVNLIEAFFILIKERPTCILSTGAGPAVPFALIGKVLGIRVAFIETMTRVDLPSLTGRIMYKLADDFFYQWPQLARFFPSGTCIGLLV